MSRNEMVRVPRELLDASAEWLEALSDPNSAERGVAQDLREILAQPAEQHQGEPVAVLYKNGQVLTKADCGSVFDICCKVETPLYTHADPNVRWKAVADEQMQVIEGLQRRIQNADLALKVQTQNCETLRAQLAEMTTKRDRLREGLDNANININNWFKDNQKLEAKLAERDALLREVLEAFKLEPDGSCINPGRDFIRPWAAKLAALSASAEPQVKS